MRHRAELNASRQAGLTTVEVAIIGTLVMVVVFGVLEVGRAMFVMNALEEATRRGARVGTVCPVGDLAIAEITVFNDSGGGAESPLVGGLEIGHVELEYLDLSGNVLGSYNGASMTAYNGSTATPSWYGDIEFVRARIEGFPHRLLIPLFMTTFTMPPFPTTLPRESLGVSREDVTGC